MSAEKVVVRHDGPWGDWRFACPAHDEGLSSYSWESAYVAALGHLCMYHPSTPREVSRD